MELHPHNELNATALPQQGSFSCLNTVSEIKTFQTFYRGFHKSKGYFDCAFLMQVTDNNLYLKASFPVYLEIKVIEGKERV